MWGIIKLVTAQHAFMLNYLQAHKQNCIKEDLTIEILGKKELRELVGYFWWSYPKFQTCLLIIVIKDSCKYKHMPESSSPTHKYKNHYKEVSLSPYHKRMQGSVCLIILVGNKRFQIKSRMNFSWTMICDMTLCIFFFSS